MKDKVTKNKYFKQILLGLLAASLIPICVLSFFVGQLLQRQRDALYEQRLQTLQSRMSQLEMFMQFVETSMNRVVLDTNTLSYLNLELNASNFQEFNSLRETLRLIVNTDEHLEDVFFINMEEEWIASTSDVRSLESSQYEDLSAVFCEIQESSFWYSDEEALYLVKQIPVFTISNRGFLAARFQRNTLEEDVMALQEDVLAVVLDGDGNFLLGDDEAMKILNQSGTIDMRTLTKLAESETTESIGYEGGSYTMMAVSGESYRWIYVLILPDSVFNGELRQMWIMILIMTVCMLLADILVISVVSKKLFAPIERVDELAERGMGEYSETIEHVEDKVRHLVDQNLRMDQEIKAESRRNIQVFLRSVYEGDVEISDDEIFIEKGITDQHLEGFGMYVLGIQYNELFRDEKEKNLFQFALENMISEMLSPSETFPLVAIRGTIYTLFYRQDGTREGAGEKASAIAYMITTAVKKYLHMSVNVGISQIFFHVAEIARAVGESSKALRDLGNRWEGQSFYDSLQPTAEEFFDKKAGECRKHLLSSLRDGEKEACRQYLETYFSLLNGVRYYLFRLEIGCCVSEILNYYAEYGLTPDYMKVGEILDFDLLRRDSSLESLCEEIWNCLLEPLFDRMCEPVSDRDVILKVAEYLNERIEEDISLDDCARHFNYNSNYMSRMFKKNFGKTYTEYVISLRMERCKELLTKTDISVNDLAERFHYSSPQNFIRVFKKYTLMTPGQFRKENRNKRN